MSTAIKLEQRPRIQMKMSNENRIPKEIELTGNDRIPLLDFIREHKEQVLENYFYTQGRLDVGFEYDFKGKDSTISGFVVLRKLENGDLILVEHNLKLVLENCLEIPVTFWSHEFNRDYTI